MPAARRRSAAERNARQSAPRAGGRSAGGRRPRPTSAGKAPAPPQRKHSDLLGRILVAIPAAVLAVVFVDFGGLAWTLLVAALACVCLAELYPLLERWRPLSIVGYAGTVGMCLVAYFGDLSGVIGVAVATLPVMVLGILARGESERATLSIAATLLGVFWIGFSFAHAVLLRGLMLGTHNIGKGLVIDVLVGTFVADAAAYFGGRLFGRHLLAPTISPKKTVEGLGCGVIAAILSVFCATLFQPWLPHDVALLMGIAIAALGPLGDLFESLIKRNAGVKDAGVLFGAHGGALDRLDAISFTIVAAYYVSLAIPGVH